MRPRLAGFTLCAVLGVALLAPGVAEAAAPAAPAPASVRAADCSGLPKHANHPVVDAANVVPPEVEAYLIADLMAYRVMGNEAIVAVTVKDLGGDDVSSYAQRLFECWGIGDAQSDNGILILLAMREQRVRIELGAGLADRIGEPELDAALGTMVAPLRAGDVGGGFRAAATSLAGALGNVLPNLQRGKPGGARPTAPASADPGNVTDGDTAPDGGPIDDVPVYDTPVDLEDLPPGVGPFAPSGGAGGAGNIAALVPILFVVGIVATIARAIARGSGLSAGGGSTWRGGFPGAGGFGWSTPSVLRGGAWHIADSPPGSWGGGAGGGWRGGSSWGDSGGSSSGSGGSGGSSSGGSSDSGGSSFGGGSSGGGGASGSW